MSGRGLLVLLVLLLAAVAIVVWVDRPSGKEEEKKTESLGSLLPGKLEDVAALELDRGGTLLRVERRGEKSWRLAHPIDAEADPRQVKSLFDAAADARIERVVEEKASDAKPYGLEPPEIRLRVFRTGSDAPVELAVGRSSPVGAGRYVSPGDGKVLLVDGLPSSTFERDADALRERRLLPVDPGDVQKIIVEHPPVRLTLVRQGTEWRLHEPVEDAADPQSADALVRSLANLSFARFLDPGELAKAHEGLVRPAVTATVEVSGTATAVKAEISSAGPPDQRYACRAAPSTCGTVQASALKDLEREPDEVRDRRLVLATGADVREVRFEQGGTSLRVWRTGAADSGEWSAQEGTGAAVRADGRKVEDLLDRLRWLRASSFESAAAPPALGQVVALQGEKGELGRLEVSTTPHDVPQRLFVRSSWRPGVLVSVAADGIGSLPRSAADLAPGPAKESAASTEKSP